MTDLSSACSHGVSPLELLLLGPFCSLSPEQLVPASLQKVDPQNVAQGGLALPGAKGMLKLSPTCCIQTFPLLHLCQPAEVEQRDVAREVLGTSPQGQKPQQIQLSLKRELVLCLWAILPSKQNNFILVSMREIE